MWVKHKYQSAFTIVELLIVIVVIAILAAISIVAYNGIQSRARTSAVNSALVQSAKKIALWQIDNPSTAPDCDKFKELTGATGTSCNGDGVKSSSITYQYSPNTPIAGAYCITATTGSTSYSITGTTQPSSDGCRGHGIGGASPITNLADGASASMFLSNGRFGFRSDRYGSDVTYSLLTGVTTPVPSLTTAARITWKTTSVGGRGFDSGYNADIATTTSGYPVAGGQDYTVSAYSRGTVTNTAYITCRLWDSSGATVSSRSINGPNISTSWQRYSNTITAPSNAAYIGCGIRLQADSSVVVGDTMEVTGLMLTTGSSLYNYADGNSTNWIWNGTANSSTSTGPST